MKPQIAIVPGVILGSISLILFISLFASPQRTVLAENLPIQNASTEKDHAPLSNPSEEADKKQACSLSPSFPDSVLQWCEMITFYADQNNLDPKLIAAVMLQESGGNKDAYSASGAVGLMQVMPRDGIAAQFMCINGPCFASRPTSAELSDPEFNVSFGSKMLAGLISKKGSIREGLKAYGPMNIDYRYADIVLSIYNNY